MHNNWAVLLKLAILMTKLLLSLSKCALQSRGLQGMTLSSAGCQIVLMLYLASPPVLRRGTIQALPCKGPHGRGCELSRIKTAATISLSATGSRKAPKAEISFCKHGTSAQHCTIRSCQLEWEHTCRTTPGAVGGSCKRPLGVNAHPPLMLHPYSARMSDLAYNTVLKCTCFS